MMAVIAARYVDGSIGDDGVRTWLMHGGPMMTMLVVVRSVVVPGGGMMMCTWSEYGSNAARTM